MSSSVSRANPSRWRESSCPQFLAHDLRALVDSKEKILGPAMMNCGAHRVVNQWFCPGLPTVKERVEPDPYPKPVS